MKKSRLLATMFLLATSILSSSVSSAQVTDSDKKLAKVSWSAFRCSTWALIKGDKAEATRLFTIGYESGKKYISLIQKYGSKALEAYSIAPSGFVQLMEGPSIDFMLGSIHNAASSDAAKEVYDTSFDAELSKIIAQNKYHTGNCELIR